MGQEKLRIIFDLDDTLIPNTYRYQLCDWRCGLIVTRALGFRGPPARDIVNRYDEIDKEQVKTMGFSVKRYPSSWVRCYEEYARRVGLETDPRVSEKLFQTASQFAASPFRPFKESRCVLQRLRRQGHSLCLLTLGEPELQERKIRDSGLADLFRRVVIVERDKKTSMEALASVSRHAVMVGDSRKSDILPAKELGLITVWIPSGNWSFADADVQPDYEIRGIADLPATIDLITAVGHQA